MKYLIIGQQEDALLQDIAAFLWDNGHEVHINDGVDTGDYDCIVLWREGLIILNF